MINEKWFFWIPTNLGELQYSLILKNLGIEPKNKKELRIENLDLYYLTDTLEPKKSETPKGLFEIKELSKSFVGSLKINYPKELEISLKFKIFKNGKTELSYISIKSDVELQANRKEIIQACSTVIKNIVHGNNHHHQKIDTIISVQKSLFNEEQVLKDLILHVKNVESDVKNIKYNFRKAKNYVEEMKGFLSYIKTFILVFKIHEDLSNKYIGIAESLISSIEAQSNKKEFSVNIGYQFGVSILTLIIIFNIFLEFHCYQISPFFYVPTILFLYMYFLKHHIIASLFYRQYEEYEKILNLLKLQDSKKVYKRLNWKQKIIKFIFPEIKPFIILVFIVSIMLGLYKTY
jgi:uncharacterized protein YfcZ (UPF0381/DUF406 family)